MTMQLLGLLAACSDYGVNEQPEAEASAKLAVDPEHLDFGVHSPGDLDLATFTVTNLGPDSAVLDETVVTGAAFSVLTDVGGVLLDNGRDTQRQRGDLYIPSRRQRCATPDFQLRYRYVADVLAQRP